jgi:tape measure domain-containing protein
MEISMISLGDINFGVTPDISRLQKAVDAIQKFGAVTSRMAASQAEGAKAAAAALAKQEAASIAAYKAVRSLQDSISKAGAPAVMFTSTTNQLNGLVKAMTSGQLSALEFQRAQERFDLGLSNARRTLKAYTDDQKALQKQERQAERETATKVKTLAALDRALATASTSQMRFNAATAKYPKAPTSITSRGVAAQDELLNALSAPNLTRDDISAAVFKYRDALAQANIELRKFAASERETERAAKQQAAALQAAERAAQRAARQQERQQALALRTAENNAVRQINVLGTIERSQAQLMARLGAAQAPSSIGGNAAIAAQAAKQAILSTNISRTEQAKALQAYKTALTEANIALRKYTDGERQAQREAIAQATAAKQTEAAIIRQANALAMLERAQTRLVGRLSAARAPVSLADGATTALNNARSVLNNPASSRGEQLRAIQAYRQELAVTSEAIRQFTVLNREASTAVRVAATDAVRAQKQEATQAARAAREAVRIQREEAAALKASETNAIRLADAIAQVERAQSRLEHSITRAKAPSDVGANSRTALQTLRTTYANPNSTRTEKADALRAYRDELLKSQQALKAFTDEHVNGNAGVSSFARTLREVASATMLYTGPMGVISTRMTAFNALMTSAGVTTAAAAAGIAAGTAAFVGLSKSIIDVERDLDRATRALKAVTGSNAMAFNSMHDLMNIANKTGQEFETLVDPYTKWLAAIKGTGLEGDRGREAFTKLAGSMTLLGVQGAASKNAFLALTQMLSKGVVVSEEARKQFGNAMPAAMKVMADAVGTTTDKMEEMFKKKSLSPDKFIYDVANAYARFTGLDVAGKLGGISAAENRLSNQWLALRDIIDKNIGITRIYVEILDKLTGYMEKLGTFVPKVKASFLDLGVTVKESIADVLQSVKDKTGTNLFDSLIYGYRKEAMEWRQSSEDMKNGVNTVKSAFQGALVPVEDYVKAQKDAKVQVKSYTDEYIANQKRIVEERRKAMVGAQEHASSFEANKADDVDPMRYAKMLLNFKLRAKEAEDAYTDAKKTLEELNSIKDKSANNEWTPPIKEEDTKKLARVTRALREFGQELEKYRSTIGHAGNGAEAFREFKEQLAEKTELDKWNDKLVDAGHSAEVAAQKVALLKDVLHKVKAEEKNMELYKTPMQELASVFDGLTRGMDTFVSSMMRGTLSWKTFGDIGISIIEDLIKELMRLAIMNPLKNFLFGSRDQTLAGFVNGGPGVGGFIGSLFNGSLFNGSLFNGGAAAKGMAITPGGFRMDKGGLLTSPTMLHTPAGRVLAGEAGNEAILPLMRTSGGRLGVSAHLSAEKPSSPPIAVHFHGAPPGKVEESIDQSTGGRRLDAYFGDMMAYNTTQRGSSMQTALYKTYGLSPKPMRRGKA